MSDGKNIEKEPLGKDFLTEKSTFALAKFHFRKESNFHLRSSLAETFQSLAESLKFATPKRQRESDSIHFKVRLFGQFTKWPK